MIELEDYLPTWIKLDENRLRQILLNLIGNAIKFTEEGYIKIVGKTIKRDETKIDLSLQVIDTGIGIPSAEQEDVFGSFDQQDSTTEQGTGLGLAITKRLTEMMVGEISLESEVGEGSKFEIEFSEVEYQQRRETDSKDKSAGEDLEFKSAQILVVDDIASNRKLLTSILQEEDLGAVTAFNGAEAIELAIEQEFDLILMDLKMPEVDGYQALIQIKQAGLNQCTPVLALTASITDQEIKKINHAGFDAFLSKPIKKEDLIELLSDYLSYESIEEESSDLEVSFSGLDEVQLEELVDELETKILSKYTQLKDAFTINEVEEFAKQLYKLAAEYEVKFLIDYACQLQDQVRGFEVVKIKESLDQFEDLLAKLKAAKK
ncbi:MAG: ATP-binding protein [Halanaerobacter sp.]